MRNPLNKSIIREFKNNLARYLSIGIVMVVMISAVSGFLSVVYSAKDQLEASQIEYKVEDGQLSFEEKINNDVIDKMEDLSLNVYENFYSEQKWNEDTTVRLFQERTDVNIQILYDGRLPNQNHEIALDRLFAEKNDLEIGDTFQVADAQLTIVGTVALPDYSSLIQKNSDLMMDPVHFGVGIVDDSTFDELIQSEVTYNYSYSLNERTLSDKEKYDIANDMKDICVDNQLQLTNLMTAQMNQAISFLPNDMGSDIPMIQTLLYIMLVILAFVFVVISQTVIEDESTVIGTLMASGYSKKELVTHYMVLPIFIIVISAIIGNIFGYTIMPPMFEKMYYGSYSLPPLQLHLNVEALLLTTIIPMLLMIIIQWCMLSHKLNISPLRFLRKDIHKTKKRRYIHLRSGAFMKRFRIRIILQNKGSYLTLFFGILFASFIFMFGVIMQPSLGRYIENLENDVKAEYQYILKVPVEVDDAEKITMTSLQTHYDMGDLDMDISFYGLKDSSDYYSMELPENKNKIVISYDFSMKFGYQVGDTIQFNNPYTEKEYTFEVSDIYQSNAGFAVYMKQQNLNQVLDEKDDYFNGYLSNQKLDINEHYIQSYVSKDDTTKIAKQMTETFSQMTPIMTSVAVIIYLVVIYILAKLVIDKNVSHMSFLKVMGYDDKEIKKLYLHSTTITVIVALIISLPFCYYGLGYLIQYAFMQFTGYMEVYISYPIYALVLGVGCLTYAVTYFILKAYISKVNLGESLKEVE